MEEYNLRLPFLGRFVQECVAQEKARYEAANYHERREMTGIMRHLRYDVGMNQSVFNRV